MTEIRRHLSNTLVRTAFQRYREGQELTGALEKVSTDAPGYGMARIAVRRAQRFSSFILWLGFRVRPAKAHPHL